MSDDKKELLDQVVSVHKKVTERLGTGASTPRPQEILKTLAAMPSGFPAGCTSPGFYPVAATKLAEIAELLGGSVGAGTASGPAEAAAAGAA